MSAAASLVRFGSAGAGDLDHGHEMQRSGRNEDLRLVAHFDGELLLGCAFPDPLCTDSVNPIQPGKGCCTARLPEAEHMKAVHLAVLGAHLSQARRTGRGNQVR